ncbi:hypothetical protein [Actinomycetospora flava]|uniref:Uncharacterized protein n=1 Tax=Actinomycetospora flava TaxID=3129232 RepID=A0ABU8MA83_9PSEU
MSKRFRRSEDLRGRRTDPSGLSPCWGSPLHGARFELSISNAYAANASMGSAAT